MPGSLIRAAAAALEPAGLLAALPRPDWLTLLGSFALVFGVQQLVPPTNEHGWYKQLRKPDWTPPNWVFPAVWIPLKILQSVALACVITAAPSRQALALPVGLFSLHLLLGNMWNVVFFGRHQMRQSTRWMAAFWASIGAAIGSFWQVCPAAALMFAPTQVWVTIAAKLNWDIVQLNTGSDKSGGKTK